MEATDHACADGDINIIVEAHNAMIQALQFHDIEGIEALMLSERAHHSL